MIPFRFGARDRQMYGVYHPPEDRSASTAVLLANPLGQEAIRTQRIYRVLAERIARAGMGVLRFDYYATGDSSGADEAGDLDGWKQDVLTAHAELLRRSRARSITWLGARLGATLCVLAREAGKPSPKQVILWEPIVEGRPYLEEIASEGEALGFGIGAALASQISALTGDVLAAARPEQATMLLSRSDDPAVSLAERWSASGASVNVVESAERFEWTSEEAMNTAIVPPAIIQLLVTRLASAPA